MSRRTRQALEALGPTFVKLGQILSTRSDLLPADWIAEFEQLQSAGPTLDFETLRPEVEAALGGPPEQVFARFDAAGRFSTNDLSEAGVDTLAATILESTRSIP